MKTVTVAVLLVVVFFCFAALGYIFVTVDAEGKGVVFTIGVAILSILLGALAASISSTIKIYQREKRWAEVRAMMYHEGKGRD